MRVLCLMNADKQTYLIQTGPGKGTQPSGTTSQGRKPIIPMESIQSVGESEIPGNHKISAGMNHQSQLGTKSSLHRQKLPQKQLYWEIHLREMKESGDLTPRTKLTKEITPAEEKRSLFR